MSWRKVTLSDLGTIFDGPHATPTRQASGPYFLNIASLNNGRLDLDQSDHIAEPDFLQWTRRVVPRGGDLLFSYETRLGQAALMPDEIRACLGRRMALLRPNPTVVNPRFLLYLYLSPAIQYTIDRHAIHGATVNRIGLATMAEWPVELPELREQRAISDILGALDDKISANLAAARSSRKLAAAYFHRAHIEAQSSGQDYMTIDELIKIDNLSVGDGYRTKRAEHAEVGFRIIRVADVNDGTVKPTSSDRVGDEFTKEIGGKAGQPRDIILTTKGTIGRVAMTPQFDEKIVYSPQICYFRCADQSRVGRYFLRYWFESDEFRRQAGHRMNNTDMAPYISLTDIRSLQLTVPPESHMRALSAQLSVLENAAQGLLRENDGLAKLRDTLLPHLMSGRLRVKDAEKQVEAVV